jgi:hypothetical protein
MEIHAILSPQAKNLVKRADTSILKGSFGARARFFAPNVAQNGMDGAT